ncbi:MULTISPECIES: hypothetical protein [unclassified Methylobacterium]|uniref:hypothetical protein n=1 Tax=unclassified Methylobacterium TaxID=2615210 RepID=UPI000CA84D48|nr:MULTISPECIES: hypothetical protein [unclassified Methylobacterium]PIU04251.1 MAG: hypothetical protein COT56_21015 [Methylobacterium sp. CG09_land_8_20_14_0_10_71_15]PIU12538.1 MAG: hypothetical protein COT28_14735 [Methylobacterium sp. CG08_land_8_20_14_0_20_71_15]GBU16267.1 hypothetical protein AwMethylo_04820 [Methylobacterium sp.]
MSDPRTKTLMDRLEGYAKAIDRDGQVRLQVFASAGIALIGIGPNVTAWELRLVAKFLTEQALEIEKALAPRPLAVPLDGMAAPSE